VKNVSIVPAILTNDPADLELKLRQAESFCTLAQLDIMDGKFVPSTSIGFADLAKIKTSLTLEVHLMVFNPELHFEGFKNAGAKRILFHYEATTQHAALIQQLKAMSISPGIVINPETPASALAPLWDDLDMILLMAVTPGFYGAPFIPEVLDKARELAKVPNKKFILALDGGVKLDNAKIIADAGVEQLDVGSAIFKGDPVLNYNQFLDSILI
jgi:ribulose-phosphate 3-epimerase